MKQVAGRISTYSSDAFGVCSALYELGGMVVMHDASGCNSTYTTHDEPRWYDMDSAVFISAVSEMEAILGDDEKLIGDIVEAAKDLHPAFIAIVGAPIPYMTGTDFRAIAAVTEKRTGIPCMGFEANGMNGYLRGVSMALAGIVRRFCRREIRRSDRPSVNILGATPLDFSVNGSVGSIRSWLLENGLETNACFAMGSTLDEIRSAGRAHVNLVVSYGGLDAARALRQMFGIPYVVGVPVGKAFAAHLAAELLEAAADGSSRIAYRGDTEHAGNNTGHAEYAVKNTEHAMEHTAERFVCPADSGGAESLAIVGESVYSASLAEALWLERGIQSRVLCPVDTEAELLRAGDLMTPEEDDLLREFPNYAGVVADPLYRAICPEKTRFYALPHTAFSGRMYEKEIPDLIGRSLTPDCK